MMPSFYSVSIVSSLSLKFESRWVENDRERLFTHPCYIFLMRPMCPIFEPKSKSLKNDLPILMLAFMTYSTRNDLVQANDTHHLTHQ